MANKIFLQDYNNKDDIFDFPLVDDINLEIVSQFESFSDTVPIVGDLLDSSTLLSAGLTGEIDSNLLTTKNLFDIPKWKKTEPIKFVAKLIFNLKKNPRKDIFDPMKKIMSYSMLSSDNTGKYIVPGISLASAADFQTKDKKSLTSKNSKLLSVYIPGVVYLPIAIVERAAPMYSKEITESGFPLWGQLDVSFIGTFPANTNMIDNADPSMRITTVIL